MKQQDRFLLAFYRGQECILHKDTGLWILCGDFDDQVVCKKYIGTPEEDCMIYKIDEVQFIFKPVHDSLLKRCSDSVRFIKHKADKGYWVGDQNEFGKTFLKVEP